MWSIVAGSSSAGRVAVQHDAELLTDGGYRSGVQIMSEAGVTDCWVLIQSDWKLLVA